MILASHVQAIGLSQRVRQRTATERPLDTPFAGIASAVHDYVEAAFGSERFEAEEAAVKSFVARCARALADVTGHLENYGVSIDLVYQLERAQLSLQRMSVLVELYGRTAPDPRAAALFVAALIRANDAAGQRALAAAGKPEAHDPAHRRVRAQDRRPLHHARRHRVSRDGGVGGDRRRASPA